jgi:opacity protein-like surface antigen
MKFSDFHFAFAALFLLLLLPFASLHAQESEQTDGENSSFGFRAAGVNVGWYNPSMSYWNDTYFPDQQWSAKFKGNLIYTGFLEINVIRNLRLGFSGSYWTERVNSGEIKVGEVTGSEQLTTSLTFLSVDALYRFGFLTFAGISPYAGAGGSFVMVQNKFVRQPTGYDEESYSNQGQDVTGSVIVGLERVFASHLGVALDFRYIFGGYTQEMKDSQGSVTSHNVTLSGPRIGLSLSYLLK